MRGAGGDWALDAPRHRTLVFVGPSAAVPAAVAVVMLAEGCIARSPSRTVILAGSDLPVTGKKLDKRASVWTR